MTTTLKQYSNGKIYVYLDLEERSGMVVLEVGICDIVGGVCLNPYKKMSYLYKDKKKAFATFNRYVREAKTEEV